ncbi:glutamate decarboxylase [Acrasis kona]|uniref:Glutamate decarboxylase n=1 Tax=Acrasis kona TaxID=1008807 RepID=A0AAW2Z931_9EUKA
MVHLSTISHKRHHRKRDQHKHNNVNKNGTDNMVYSSSGVYGSRFAVDELPKNHLPDQEMPSNIAYKLISDELALDSKPILNLASFVTTYMEPEAEQLMTDSLNKNFIDYEEYPATCDLQNRCVAMIGHLFNVPENGEEEPMGVTTVGSSEAIMLAVLAMKKRWQNRRKEQGKDYSRPNMVMGANVQVCWEKAARYFEIEEKYVFCTQTRYVLDPQEAVDLVDENTIGICVILGSTYTGEYEDAQKVDQLLREKNEKMGYECPIHIDAASGGFVAPFVNPDLVWDFRLPTVVSINASGHKYGLVYPGIGISIWRSKECLPKELIFNINYLGADQASFTLNFSKGASNVIALYYQLVRLGFSGYKAIMMNLTNDAIYLAEKLEASGCWEIMSARGIEGLPLVAFRLKEKHYFDEYDVAKELRQRQWVVPAYTMAPNAKDLKMLRIVLREDFDKDQDVICSCRDLNASIERLSSLDKKQMEGVRELNNSREETSSHGRNPHHQDKKGAKHGHSLQGKFGKSHNVC